MRFDDYFLEVSLQEGRRRFRVHTMDDKELAIDDLAARMGRGRASVYQLLRNFPVGTHGVSFQELIRKSAGRKYNARMTAARRLVADSAHAAAVHAVRGWLTHKPDCALERYQKRVLIYAAKFAEHVREMGIWTAGERERKKLRDAGYSPPHFPQPEKPEPITEAQPACSCGLHEAERELIDSLDNLVPEQDASST